MPISATKTNVKVLVSVDGNPLLCRHIQLEQRSDWHHSFTAYVKRTGEETNPVNKVNQYLGKPIQIEFQYASAGVLGQVSIASPNKFLGIITDVSLETERGRVDENLMVLRGLSPTTFLDDSINTQSFTEQSLQQIVDTVLQKYQGNLTSAGGEAPDVSPEHKTTIPYLVQYKENAYEFLYRLARIYGEWFYYDGEQLVFKKPESGEAIELTYELDLYRFNLSTRVRPAQFKLSGYDYEKHEFLDETGTNSTSLGEFASIAYSKSEEMYAEPSLEPIGIALDKEELTRKSERRMKGHVSGMMILTGISKNPKLKIGATVVIQDMAGTNYGEYIITEVNHELSFNGNYQNSFRGIPIENEVPNKYPMIRPVVADSQVAEVTDFSDPDGLGRVKVQFVWQRGTSETSPWIRVSSPYTGADKGSYFIPEVGDEVLVGFEEHNPDKPYILNGLYHANANPEMTDPDNNLKAIKTRTGHTVLFNDTKGSESITITDKNRNRIHMDTKEKTIVISSEENIIMTSKVIAISGEQVAIQASENLSLDGKETTSIGSKVITIQGTEIAVLGKKNVTVSGKTKLDLMSNSTTTLQGAIVNIN